MASSALGRAVAVLLSWVGRRADLAVMCTVLVVHLGALPSIVALVAASGLLEVVRELAHREKQVRRRCEAQVLETAVCVVKQYVVHLGAPRVVHVTCDAVRAFLQVDPHDFKDFSIVVGDGSRCD